MKTIEQKRAELEKAKNDAMDEAQALYQQIELQYNTKIEQINNDLELLDRAEALLSEKGSNQSIDKQTGNHFAVKGTMSVREGLLKVFEDALPEFPLTIDEIMDALKRFGVESDRGSVRARLTKSVKNGEILRVNKGVYKIAA